MSNIDTSGIDVTKPQQGSATTQSVRDNFSAIKTALDTAAAESADLSGVTDAAVARGNLGLGTMATQNAANVSITGGSISGITDLALADGGTGASTAADARSNLSVPSIAELASGEITVSDWSGGKYSATYVSASVFRVTGTHTNALTSEAEFHVGRRVLVQGATLGTKAGTITGVATGANTDVTVSLDDGSSLVNEALTVYLGEAVLGGADPLRPALAESTGATLVGHGSGTVADALNTIDPTPASVQTFKVARHPEPSIASLDTKLIERRAGDAAWIYKQVDGGYAGFLLESGIVTSTDSAGGSGELIRVTTVHQFAEILVALRTVAASSATVTIDYANAETLATRFGRLATNTRKTGSLTYHRLEAGDTISYTLPASSYRQERFNVAFVTSALASSDVTVDVNGVSVGTVDTNAGDNRILRVSFDLPFSKDSTAADQTVTISAGSNPAYVIGLNFYYLRELGGQWPAIDYFAAFATDLAWRTNKGASDYAIYDADASRWIGSYHGGETRTQLRVEADGAVLGYAAQTSGTLTLCRSLRFYQQTNIDNKLTARSYHDFSPAGGYDFRCVLDGNVNTTTLYTAMATTTTDFEYVEYPVFAGPLVSGNDYPVETGANAVWQYSSTNTPMKASIEYSQYSSRYSDGAYVRSSAGNYNKVYYGPIINNATAVNVADLSFAAKHRFYS